MRKRLALALVVCSSLAHAQSPDWPKIQDELMQHFQALLRIDTTDPPGNETKAVEYIGKVLGDAGIPLQVVAQDPARANLIARLRGNGSKRPILLMGHLDTVQVDVAKWTYPPFSATRKDGYVYRRGVLDNKWQVAAGMMTMLMLKRGNVALDRDIIVVAEAGEEGSTGPGIEYLVSQHWSDLGAEACIAEGGTVRREVGQVRFAMVQTAEKIPRGAKLVSSGPSGHGSRPLRTNAILHLSQAVEKVALWDPPMRLNNTTRSYFEKLATLSDPATAKRFNSLLDPAKAPAVLSYLAENDPNSYSMLHTSISPNMITGGFQVNVIPSHAEATLDIRALPDEDMPAFYDLMRKVINDPAVEVVPNTKNARPGAPPSRIDSEVFHAIETANRNVYHVPTIPQMSTGATDMSFLRAKGMQCYGVGVASDIEDLAKGFGAHSDQERILETSLNQFLQFQWDFINVIAVSKH